MQKSNRKILIWDYNHEHIAGTVTHLLTQILPLLADKKSNVVIFQPFDKTPEVFAEFCRQANQCYNIVVVVEEIEHFADHYIVYTQPQLKRLIDSGRHQGLGLICTSRRVMWLASDIPANLDHWFIFRVTRPQDLKYMAEWVGDDVYKIVDMKEHAYLWYDDLTGKVTLQKPLSLKA